MPGIPGRLVVRHWSGDRVRGSCLPTRPLAAGIRETSCPFHAEVPPDDSRLPACWLGPAIDPADGRRA